jgi:hypothetical protein
MKKLNREHCTLDQIILPWHELSAGHGKARRLRYLEEDENEQEEASKLFSWIEKHYTLADCLKQESHWQEIQRTSQYCETAGKFRDSYYGRTITPQNLVHLHFILFFRRMTQTRIDAAFDLLRRFPLDSIPSKLKHTPFQRANKKRMSLVQWMAERKMSLPGGGITQSGSAGEEVELGLSHSIEQCKFVPISVPKGTGLVYDNTSTDPKSSHFRGVLKTRDEQLYWAEAWIR